jgi:hypothetical protein
MSDRYGYIRTIYGAHTHAADDTDDTLIFYSIDLVVAGESRKFPPLSSHKKRQRIN